MHHWRQNEAIAEALELMVRGLSNYRFLVNTNKVQTVTWSRQKKSSDHFYAPSKNAFVQRFIILKKLPDL